MSIRNLMRENIASLEPYRCARDEFEGSAEVYLDANENWRQFIETQGEINRYPDPRSLALRAAVEEVLGLKAESTIIGNGSDELIDLMFRIFCNPGKDNVLLLGPTYGAYKVFAAINDIKVNIVALDENFLPSIEETKKAIDKYNPKLLFICTPNNPTGNAIPLSIIRELAAYNKGITVVDEAYFEFSKEESAASLVFENERVVLLRTLSKCWALAGARVGIAMCSAEIHEAMYNTKYPYNLGLPTQQTALKALMKADEVLSSAKETIKERERLSLLLMKCSKVVKVYPSDANFLLVKVTDANKIYIGLRDKGIIVRNRSHELNCSQCLRITVGSREENDKLLAALEAL